MTDIIKQIKKDIFDPKRYLNIAIISAIIGGGFQALLLLSIDIFYLRFFSITQMIADTISILLPLSLIFIFIWLFLRLLISSFKRDWFWGMLIFFISTWIIAYYNSITLLIKYLLIGGTILWIIRIIFKNKEKVKNSKWFIKIIQIIIAIVFMSILLGFSSFIKNWYIQRIFISPTNFINQEAICNNTNNEDCNIKYFNDKYIFVEKNNSKIEVIKFENFFNK